MAVNYFTCTLGPAVNYQHDKAFNTVNELVDLKAKHHPDLPAVGFYRPTSSSSQPWKYHILGFNHVLKCSISTARFLERRLDAPAGQTVALLCPSNAEFLFTWLGLMRLGHPVLLIAPQCSPSAIAHLCKTSGVQYLLHDELYEELATEASLEPSDEGKPTLQTLLLPITGDDMFETQPDLPSFDIASSASVKAEDVAYLHHTSGTSSGVPKPIPQTHRGAVGVLPMLEGGKHATFTTTPLYHGGVADLFRAWTSNALIWLFPGKDIPITAANVCMCLDISSTASEDGTTPPVKYYTSVPYILQMMSNNERGLKHLQNMDMVGVGGAALPADVGDDLVSKGVNLVSRFGSAECGFLMSSHRDYTKDKEWQYLRSTGSERYLHFEPQEDCLAELVIQPDWPHMAKRNREDGSFATADLFVPHSSIPNAWRYHSRSDAQLTLITGKKFDPAPLEDTLCATSTLVSDALIFGNGKPYPGVLLFRSKQAEMTSDDEMVTELASLVEKLNKESQSHARIPRHMLIPMSYSEINLEKSSKGTILRNKAEEKYAHKIDAAYRNTLPNGNKQVPDEEVPKAIRDIVLSVVGEDHHGRELFDDTDLFSFGVDSVACMQIRHALSHLVPDAKALQMTVVEDAGTLHRLSKIILGLRSGRAPEEQDDQHQLMLELAKEYSQLETVSSPSSDVTKPRTNTGITVLLTGPTGSLGSHILHQLLSDQRVLHIYLLVRGASLHAARGRVLKALSTRQLSLPSDFDTKTTILQCNLSSGHLGLSDTDYKSLTNHVDVIMHLAWSVNFLLPLRSYINTHLAGLRNLLQLASFSSSSEERKSPLKFIFCSSVASTSNYLSLRNPSSSTATVRIPESFIPDPNAAGPTGYARSKWVGEAICSAVHASPNLRNRIDISIARVGQLSGASDTGIWSTSEAYPLLLSTLKVTGVLPDLKGEVCNWVPVDIAAAAFLEDALSQKPDPLGQPQGGNGNGNENGNRLSKDNDGSDTDTDTDTDVDIPVTHVLNSHNDIHWSHILTWLSATTSTSNSNSKFTPKFKIVPVHEWLSKLEELAHVHDDKTKPHPALRLLGFWKKAYGGEDSGESNDPTRDTVSSQEEEESDTTASEGENTQDYLLYDMARTYARMPVLRDAGGMVDREYCLKLWRWIDEVL